MNILICDDEKEIVEAIESLITNKYADLHNVYCFSCADEIELFLQNESITFDIAFMDIELREDESCGMEIASRLKSVNCNIEIIYVTGYADKYDEEIFDKIKPYGLLRKPVKQERMFRYIDEISTRQVVIEVIVKGNKMEIPIKNIILVEHEKRKVSFITGEGKTTVYMKLHEVQELLPNYFIRCHNSYIVNYFKVDIMNKNQFVLSNGTAVPISRTFKESAKKQFLLLKGGCI